MISAFAVYLSHACYYLNVKYFPSFLLNYSKPGNYAIYGLKKIIPARDPKQWEGAKGDETSGGDDDDDDTQMRAQRSRHRRAQESTHMRGQRRRHI